MIKIEIKNLLKGGLKEINLSKYPFGVVREALEEMGYKIGTSVKGEYQEVTDWINGGELDYWADIFTGNHYTGYTITGSFGYGTCNIVNYDFHN